MRGEQIYRDRRQAGAVLAEALTGYRDEDVLVLGLPRGGMPVAFAVAQALGAPLDVFVVRKLGAPGDEELAMGAVASGGGRVRNEEVLDSWDVPEEVFEEASRREMAEIERREALYRGPRPVCEIAAHTALLVDDGFATGTTMRAAIQAVRRRGARRCVVAVPVGAPDTCEELERLADAVVCPLQPRDFHAVSVFYEHFPQTSDAEVKALLAR